MLDDKQRRISRSVITQLIKENKIVRPQKDVSLFFIGKAINSLQVSRKLLEISESADQELNCFMWVINTSYYSMFFAATSLLAHFGHKIDTEVGIHRITFHAMVYYFLLDDKKLQKHFIEQYKDAYDDAEQLLQISEDRAVELLENFNLERAKRHEFTYEMGMIAERSKAKTSLKRAEEFLAEVRKIVEINGKNR